MHCVNAIIRIVLFAIFILMFDKHEFNQMPIFTRVQVILSVTFVLV